MLWCCVGTCRLPIVGENHFASPSWRADLCATSVCGQSHWSAKVSIFWRMVPMSAFRWLYILLLGTADLLNLIAILYFTARWSLIPGVVCTFWTQNKHAIIYLCIMGNLYLKYVLNNNPFFCMIIMLCFSKQFQVHVEQHVHFTLYVSKGSKQALQSVLGLTLLCRGGPTKKIFSPS